MRLSVTAQVSVILKRTVTQTDWGFQNLYGSDHQNHQRDSDVDLCTGFWNVTHYHPYSPGPLALHLLQFFACLHLYFAHPTIAITKVRDYSQSQSKIIYLQIKSVLIKTDTFFRRVWTPDNLVICCLFPCKVPVIFSLNSVIVDMFSRSLSISSSIFLKSCFI